MPCWVDAYLGGLSRAYQASIGQMRELAWLKQFRIDDSQSFIWLSVIHLVCRAQDEAVTCREGSFPSLSWRGVFPFEESPLVSFQSAVACHRWLSTSLRWGPSLSVRRTDPEMRPGDDLIVDRLLRSIGDEASAVRCCIPAQLEPRLLP